MPTRYRVELKPSAARSLSGLQGSVLRRLASRIDALATNPRPPGSKKLSGEEDIFRIRVGDYRILYQIQDRVLIVIVVGIGHRRDVYRR